MSGNGTFHALLARDGPNCHYCGKYLWESLMTKEHIVPRSLGGPSALANYVLSCAPCNHARGNLNAPHKGCERCKAARDAYGHHTPQGGGGSSGSRPLPRNRWESMATPHMIARRRWAEETGRAGWPGSAPKVDGHKEA